MIHQKCLLTILDIKNRSILLKIISNRFIDTQFICKLFAYYLLLSRLFHVVLNVCGCDSNWEILKRTHWIFIQRKVACVQIKHYYARPWKVWEGKGARRLRGTLAIKRSIAYTFKPISFWTPTNCQPCESCDILSLIQNFENHFAPKL